MVTGVVKDGRCVEHSKHVTSKCGGVMNMAGMLITYSRYVEMWQVF